MDCITRQVAKYSSCAPTLPVEVIRRILLSLSPQELFALQTVSKQFHAITNDPKYWKTSYGDAHLPRPPGPFPWQSTKFFQRTLVDSARLQQRWTSQPINMVSARTLTFKSYEECRWVYGRWLIVTSESEMSNSRQLVLHDFDTGSEQTLCECTSAERWLTWAAACCDMSSRGLLLYVILHTLRQGESEEKVRLLEFQGDDSSGQLSDPITYDVPINLPDDISIVLLSGDSPLLAIFVDPWRMRTEHALVFDTRDQTFYKFPALRSDELDTEWLSCLRYGEIRLTMTHIILCYMNSASSQFIQAYVIPEGNETRELRVSHEATAPMKKFTEWSLLRNSVIDPLTGSTHLRFLHISKPSRSAVKLFVCTDITLPANSTSDILPMSVDTKDVISLYDPSPSHGRDIDHCIQSSTDGFARGLCVMGVSAEEIHVLRFTIDASHDRGCVTAVGGTFPLSLPGGFDQDLEMSFDGTRGRLCLSGIDMNDDAVVGIAVDFE